MDYSRKTILLPLAILILFTGYAPPLWAQSAEEVIQELYDLVTFEAGSTPDWDKVRSVFIDEAVIVLRTSRDGTTVFSVDAVADDWLRFIEQANVDETGFSEKIIRMKTMVFGEIAHVLVLYESSIPGASRPPRQGVDSFELIQKDGRWRIVAVTNELPTPDRPLPPELRD
jgi:hypothetical protein